MWPFKKKRKEMRLLFMTPSSACPLPIGNGDFGVFLSGGVGIEHGTAYLKAKGGHNPNNLDALTKLNAKKISDNVKKELNLGNLSVAENVMGNSLIEAGFKESETEPATLCNIDISFDRSSPAVDYRRVLDMENEIFTVSFADREGMEFRDSFVSQEEGIFCYRAYRDRGEINCQVAISAIEGQEYEIREESGYIIFINKSVGGVRGFVLGAITSGGKVSYLNGALHITHSNRFYLFGESFDCLEGESDKVIAQVIERLSKGDISFDKLFKDSRVIFSKKMNKSMIEFSNKEVENIDLEILLLKSKNLSENLLDVLYKYGKYLSFSLGRVAMSTKSLIIDNNSLDDNYLKNSRIMLGMLKMGEDYDIISFLKNIFSNKEIFMQNAKYLYNAEGLFIPSVMDEKGLVNSTSPKVLLNKNSTFLVGMMAYQLFKRTNDEELKKTILPEIIRGCSDFYMSFLKQDRNMKVLSSPFGISPYSKTKESGEMISSNCTCDYVCARFLLNALEDIEGKGEKYKDLISKIPDIVVDKDGVVKEYDLPSTQDNVSPYMPHLLPYIAGVKNLFGKREYENVLSSSVKSKYLTAFGRFSSRSLLEMALALSTLSEGADSYEVLSLMCRTFMNGNLLFSNCDNSNMAVGRECEDEYINIDVNVAITEVLQNMLINQSGENIYLANTFLKSTQSISAKNIPLQDDMTCQIGLNTKKGVMKLILNSKSDKLINIHLPLSFRKYKSRSGVLDRENMCINEINLIKNKSQKIVIYF